MFEAVPPFRGVEAVGTGELSPDGVENVRAAIAARYPARKAADVSSKRGGSGRGSSFGSRARASAWALAASFPA